MNALRGKTVLITGGTGSFGKNFAKHLLVNSKLKKLIIFSRDELKQSQMEVEMNDERIRFFIGDVRDLPRLERAFHGVDVIVHAAALKQVPALEYNPYEAVKTNILGSQNVIEAAIDQGVKKVVFVSTDKAAMPVNLYGSTKLCAEKLFIAGNSYSADRSTRFSVVRYGNVVGSRGSIIEKLILSKGAPVVHITDERMTRFWIDLEQAFEIVLFAIKNMEGGEIFIPKARAMKLTDLFDILAPKAKHKIIGIRPGEKVHEILLTKEESRHAVELKDYFVVLPENTILGKQKKGLQKHLKQGKSLKPDFHFTSDTTAKRMSHKSLLDMVKRMEKTILG
ncbi:MAG: UDP-N-acetylglucosamine 4,6-dehydratase [Parcubacteria group bacterium GW2011_GWC2_49_9]|nr:MAG: UDP-N-acetylglucosamine 4,6-dehydratase [Parcubacteria group bacterium GW2011_GWC2_49_9]